MFGLYFTWAMLPTLTAKYARWPSSRRVVFAIAVLLMATICAVQDESTNKDREIYGWLIDSVQDGDSVSLEPGFFLLVKLLGTAFSGPDLAVAFFFVVAALSVSIKLQLFRTYGRSMFGCMAAFLSYFFLLHEMTQVRTGLAVAFLYLSWFAFAEGRTRDFWLLGLVAALFHYSCMLFVVAPVLFSPNSRIKFVCVLTVASIFAIISAAAGGATLSGLEYLAEAAGIGKVGVYFELLQEGVLSEISALRLLPHTLLLAVAALSWRRWRADRLTFFVFQIYLYGVLIFIILSPVPALAYRVSDLFLFAGIFVVGRLRSCMQRNVYYPFVLAYTGVFVVYTLQFSGLFMWPNA